VRPTGIGFVAISMIVAIVRPTIRGTMMEMFMLLLAPDGAD
jgi:hypothetical protein